MYRFHTNERHHDRYIISPRCPEVRKTYDAEEMMCKHLFKKQETYEYVVYILDTLKLPTSIFCPKMEGLKLDFRTTLTSILVLPTSRTKGITRNGKLISLVVRYLEWNTR